MEIILPSTRPTEAITNTETLLRIEPQCRQSSELVIWLERANVESLRLETFIEEGATKRAATTDYTTIDHINRLVTQLTDALARLDVRIEAGEIEIEHTEIDDWNRPIENRFAPNINTPLVLTSPNLSNPIPSTRQSWTWKHGAIAAGAILIIALIGAILGGSIGPTELIFMPILAFLYVFIWGKLISRTGYSGWYFLLLFVPIANLVAVIVAVGRDWPVEKERNALRERLEAVTGHPAYSQDQ